MMRVYLDNAAATPVDTDVLAHMLPFFSEQFHNPSALYSGARTVKEALEAARSRVAKAIGSRPSEIIFTAGGTESANLAIHGIMQKYPGSQLVISAVEHDAVRMPAAQYDATLCVVDKNGVIDVATLKKAITDRVALVSVMYANSEVGTVQPIKDVVSLVAEVRTQRQKDGNNTPLYVHADACQAPLYLDCNVARLGVDLMTLNGGKIHGPKQSGILYVRAGIVLEPQIRGGGQEHGVRSGTENVAAAVGFSHALESAQAARQDNARHLLELSHWFRGELITKYRAALNGHPKRRLPNNVHVTFPGCDNERVLFALDEKGISAATGSACSASSDEASSVLLAMELSVAEARSSMRFTLGTQTTKEELEYVLENLGHALSA